MTILPPDSGNPGDLLVLPAGSCERRFEPLRIRSKRGEYDVNVRGPKRFLPMFGAAFFRVTQNSGAGRHPLLKLRRETIERCLRHTQCFESLKTEGDAHPCVSRRARRVCSRCHYGAYAAHEFSPTLRFVD